MQNKKTLLGIAAIAVVAIVGALLYMKMSGAKAYKGVWEPKNLESGEVGTLEFTNDKLILSGEFEIMEGVKAKVKLTGDYKEKEYKDGVYTLEATNPVVEVSGEGVTDEIKKEIADDTKSSLEKDKEFKFKLSSDEKELTQITKDGKDAEVYKRK